MLCVIRSVETQAGCVVLRFCAVLRGISTEASRECEQRRRREASREGEQTRATAECLKEKECSRADSIRDYSPSSDGANKTVDFPARLDSQKLFLLEG